MRSSALILPLVLTPGTYAYAASRSVDSPPTGVSMNIAKQVGTRAPSVALTQSVKLSGLPMAVAARQGAATQSEQTSLPDRALSGITMALAKRL